MKRNRLSALIVVGSFLGGSLLAACGGNKYPAKSPATFGTTAPTAGAVATDTTGQQIGTSDTLSNGDPDDRPKMNGAAKASYLRGLQAWSVGDLANAETAFTEATKNDSKAYQAFYSLGVVQGRLGKADALASYRQSYTLVPEYEPAILAYAEYLEKKNSLQEADDFLSKENQQFPKSPAILAGLAEVKSLKKDTGTAQQMAQDALKLNPDYRPAMVVLARDHYRNRRIDLALYALKAILDGEDANNPARDKNNAEAHLLRALILKEQGQRGAAIDELKTAVGLRPDFVGGRVLLAGYLLESGNAEDAQPLLEQALKFNADNTIAHLNLGDTYRILGRSSDAKKEFDYVAAKDASIAQVYYSYGLLYLFGQNIPGMDSKAQTDAAISSLEKFQTLRGKPTPGQSDDSDQLLLRAKAKQGELQAADQAAAAQASASAAAAAAPPPAASSAAPAGSAPLVFSAMLTRMNPMRRLIPAFVVAALLVAPSAFAQKKKTNVVELQEITITGRVQKPIAAVDISRIAPKLSLGELRQPFLDKIEAAVYSDPFLTS